MGDATRLLNFLNNVSSILKPNGFFFGYLMDGSVIWSRIQKCLEAQSKRKKRKRDHKGATPIVISNDYYRLEYQMNGATKVPQFGSKYTIQFFDPQDSDSKSQGSALEVVEVKVGSPSPLYTYTLIHPPTFVKYANRVNLQLVEMSNFLDFYADNRHVFGKSLTRRGIVDRAGSIPAPIQDLLGLFTIFLFRKSSQSERESRKKPPLPTSSWSSAS